MSSAYPGGIDAFPTNRTNTTGMVTTHPADHNNYADAINKIETTLGVDPQGDFASVAERLAGTAVLRGPKSFAFDSPGLNTGIEFYTPAVGDLLVGFCFVFGVDWDGTGKIDFGPFVNETTGFLSLTGVNSNGGYNVNGAIPGRYDTLAQTSSGIGEFGFLCPVIEADPWKIVGSADGHINSAPIGGTRGEVDLYIWTATPVQFA